MIKLLQILMIIAFCGIASAAPVYLVPYTQAKEKDVRSFITIGMDEKAVVGKFGPPNHAAVGKDGLEVLQYFVNPRDAKESKSKYAGFKVSLKDKKVTHLDIIHAGQN